MTAQSEVTTVVREVTDRGFDEGRKLTSDLRR